MAFGRGNEQKEPFMLRQSFLFLLPVLCLIIGACAHSPQTAPPQVHLKRFQSGQQMTGTSKTPGCMWITSEEQLSGLMAQVAGRTKIVSRPIPLPEIDFSKYGVLVVWMGQKPTGSYALELMAETAAVKKKTVLVPVRWIGPQEGMLTIQVITNPYLMVQIAKKDFQAIAVVDQNGRVKTMVNIAE
jgi:hypothetical protein